MKKIQVGIKGVDSILYGGLPKGKSILVSGNCGAGKTIFASQFITQGLKNNEPGVYVTLEEDRDKIVEDLKELGIDWQIGIDENKVRVLGGNIAYIRKLKERRKANIEDFIAEIIEVAQEIGAKRIAIDSVNLFLHLFDEGREQRTVLSELLYELSKLDTTTILTCEVPENSNAISWFGFEEFVVDGVLLLKRGIHRKVNKNTRSFEVIKMRGIDFKKGQFPFSILPQKGISVFINDPDKEFFS
jgi:circadian clock protein KaiC